jgi:hypothetical protein
MVQRVAAGYPQSNSQGERTVMFIFIRILGLILWALIVLGINVLFLAACVWVVVKVLQATGVL